MATSNNTEAGAWPQTRCANCQTVFEVPAELLESNDTRVRCGECLSIFDALQGLLQQDGGVEQPASQADITDEPRAESPEVSNLDVTYSDFDLFSEDAELPEVQYFEDANENKINFNFDSVEIEHDETFSETLFVNDVTINADLPLGGDESAEQGEDLSLQQNHQQRAHTAADYAEVAELTPSAGAAGVAYPGANGLERQAKVEFTVVESASAEPLRFEYHDPDDTGDNSADSYQIPASANPGLLLDPAPKETPRLIPRIRWWQLLGYSLLLVLLLGSLYLYRERAELYNDHRFRPVYLGFCKLTGCFVPHPFDPDQMGLVRRSIYPHPEIESALVINVVIKNKARFAQRYPVLVISLEENSGAPLATRDFSPKDYLPSHSWDENAVIEAGAAVSITLEIKDPGANAGLFTLKFR